MTRSDRPASDPPRTAPAVTVLLTLDPLELTEAYAAVAHPESGGVGLFAGVVRNHHEGTAVRSLEYEAWEEAATPALRAVAEGVVAACPGVRAVYAAHRLGPLAVGEVSVVVAASAPHRDEALHAAQLLIDRVKAEVPIWKKEHLVDGTSRWPGADPAGSGDPAQPDRSGS